MTDLASAVSSLPPERESTTLADGARVAVMGGGPAGSFFSLFLLDLAERAGLSVSVDIYEPRNFAIPGPQGCNMCGGIVSESLVQTLAMEGINLPATVVQRGIDSYVLHMDVGSVRIDTPLHEKRIAAVHRGAGPRDLKEAKWSSFDGHLQSLAIKRGANVIPVRIDQIERQEGGVRVTGRGREPLVYDLLAVAVGVNSGALKLFENLSLGYRPPETTKTYLREYLLGTETIGRHLGNSMHVFLPNTPGIEFAALIPKGDYVSVCLLGDGIDADAFKTFLESPEVRRCMPPDWTPDKFSCSCAPKMNIGAAVLPYADRLVFVGDCGVARLYKDGIGAAYRTAKAAANTAIFNGVSAEAFERHFWPTCRAIDRDNGVGKFLFGFTKLIQKTPSARRAVLATTDAEQRRKHGVRRHLSLVLWDMFTGSAPYKEIFRRTLHPGFLTGLVSGGVRALLGLAKSRPYAPASPEARPPVADQGEDRAEIGSGHELSAR